MLGYEELWAVKEKIEKIGYCSICTLVPRNAVAHNCGQLFCTVCWENLQQQKKGCPNCRGMEDVSPAHKDRITILNLDIYCPQECGKIFRLGDKESHITKECINRPIYCPSCKELTTPAKLEQLFALVSENTKVKKEIETLKSIISYHSDRIGAAANGIGHTDGQEIIWSSNVDEKKEIETLKSITSYHPGRIGAAANGIGQTDDQEIIWSSNVDEKNEIEKSIISYHPGRIGAAANGIGHTDDQEIIWSSNVDEKKEIGYTWQNYNMGWDSPLSKVYHHDSCTWSCCGGKYDSSPCKTGKTGF